MWAFPLTFGDCFVVFCADNVLSHYRHWNLDERGSAPIGKKLKAGLMPKPGRHVLTDENSGHPGMVRILFRTAQGEVETMWTFPLGGDHYKLDNNPIYPYGVSWEDVVEAPFNSREKFPTFSLVVKKSGNKTVRIIFKAKAEESKETKAVLDRLVEMGCSYEGLNQIHFSINIPPAAKFKEVCDFLTASQCQWEHGDPTYAELYEKRKKSWWWPL